MERRFSISEDEITPPRFTIDEEITRQYRRFNATGTELTVRLLPPPVDDDESNPISHFQASVTELFEYALRNRQDSDMVCREITFTQLVCTHHFVYCPQRK